MHSITDIPVRDFDHTIPPSRSAADTSYIRRSHSTIPRPSRPGHFIDHQAGRSPAFPDHPQTMPDTMLPVRSPSTISPLMISIDDPARLWLATIDRR